jgi:hypothetical protein
MFPWEVLITGAVGVGGTSLGAWLNGRMQTTNLRLSLDAENERARLSEKRRIYASYLATGNDLYVLAAHLGRMDPELARSSLKDANTAIFNAWAEVSLIAPNGIWDLVFETVDPLIKWLNAFQEDRTTPIPDELRSKRHEMILAMRADLGEPV